MGICSGAGSGARPRDFCGPLGPPWPAKHPLGFARAVGSHRDRRDGRPAPTRCWVRRDPETYPVHPATIHSPAEEEGKVVVLDVLVEEFGAVVIDDADLPAGRQTYLWRAWRSIPQLNWVVEV